MSRALRFVPLALLLAFVGFVAWRLAIPADTVIRSQLEGKQVPAFELFQQRTKGAAGAPRMRTGGATP